MLDVPTPRSQLHYRPDIDGLRALAVSAVVLYHAFPVLLPGGFVGVDLFFVISGYLISGILFSHLASGTFRFRDFYARRIRRIFPALILVLLFCCVTGWMLLFDKEFDQLGEHLLRAATFLSNFILLKETGYFDNAAETKPLLHLWSLAIEEQFYIFWPALLWLIWRFRWNMTWAIGTLLALSFIWNLYLSNTDLARDFYSPLTRFWELMAGAWLAWRERPGRHPSALTQLSDRWRATLSWLGLVLMLVSILGLNHSLRFPGGWAALPVVAGVLMIAAGPGAWVNTRLLSQPLVVGLGVISYPLYLWHWPVFSFERIVIGQDPGIWVKLLTLPLVLSLAWATQRFIENRLRHGQQLRLKTIGLIGGMILVGALGFVIHQTHGFPSRAIMQAERIAHPGEVGHEPFLKYLKAHSFPCEDQAARENALTWHGLIRCYQSHTGDQHDLLILGDSHAEHLFPGLAEALPDARLLYYGQKATPLTTNQNYRVLFSRVIENPKIPAVLLAAHWSAAIKETGTTKLAEELNGTVQALLAAGKRVYLVDDVPEFPFEPQSCKYLRPLTHSLRCELDASAFHEENSQVLGVLKSVLAHHPEVVLISFGRALCDDQRCRMANSEGILYRDEHHLNLAGSRFIARYLANQLPGLQNMH